MKKVTVKDIARMSGYSVSTVSKTLNGTDRVGAETVSKIKKIAEQAGYKSSFSAQSLARKSRKVTIVLFKDPPEVRRLFSRGFEDAFKIYGEFGIEPEYRFFGGSEDNDMSALPWDEIESESDAVIITPGAGYERVAKRIDYAAKKLPLVFLQTKPPDNSAIRLCDITVDAKTVGRMAAQFLDVCTHGGKHAVITGYNASWIHKENTEGFKSCCGNENAAVRECFDDMDKAYTVASDLIKAENPQGIFVTSYVSPAVCKAAADAGKRISVVGVDLFGQSAECLSENRLSAAIFQNQQAQARQALEAIIAAFRQNTFDDRPVKPEFVMSSNLHCYDY